MTSVLKLRISLIALLFLLWLQGKPQTAPNLKVYPPKTISGSYDSSPQNIGIIQSKAGLLYFANASGVLEFDGNFWRMIDGTADVRPRVFVMDSSGTIYAGGTNHFGFLSADSAGKFTYKSLLPLLDDYDKEFGMLHYAYSIRDAVYFLSRKQMMRYEKNEMKVWKAKSKFLGGYIINDTLYVEQEHIGLMKVVGNELKLTIPAEGDLDEFDVLNYFNGLCPCGKQKQHLIAKDSREQFFLFNGTGNLVRLSPRVSEFLKTQRGINRIVADEGKTAVGTLSDGVILIDENGEFVRLINKNDGLPDNIINALFIDAADGLWIGHDAGISRTQLNSPLTFIDQRSGYTGIVVSITRFMEKLYLSTTDGVYMMSDKGNIGAEIQFDRVEEIRNQTFSLLESNHSLLAATLSGVFEIKGPHAQRVADGIALDIFPSFTNNNIVYVGHTDGLFPLEYENGTWKAGTRIPGLNDAVYKGIADKNGVVWASNHTDKIYRIDLSDYAVTNPSISEYDSSQGVPPGWIEPYLLNDTVYFGSPNGVFQYDAVKKMFQRSGDARFHYFNQLNSEAGPLRTDLQGNTWVVSRGKAGKLIKDNAGNYQWDSTATMGIPATSIWSIYFDEHDVVWLGTTDLLVKYDTQLQRDNYKDFPTFIRKVAAGKDSILYYGAGNMPGKTALQYRYNDFAFEYAAPFFEGENLYSVKLEGNDEDWSAWSAETKIRYTNLSAGTYTFRVKAKNLFAFEGKEAAFSFTLLPPFYLTIWAYLVYALLAGLTVWGIVLYNSRRLIRAKKRLQKIIEQRTAELTLTNEELRRAKEFEEQFLANMSHEIRTPMNVVTGLTNLMLHSEVNPQQHKYLSAIRQSADNMLVILNDILDISKIQSGKLEIDEEDFSVREVITSVLDMMQLSAAQKGLRLHHEAQPDVPEYVLGDSVRLHQILLNLVNNAVKFTDKGSIAISCSVTEKNDAFIRLYFTVTDTGIGISPAQLDSIFINFKQGGKEIARKYGGTGLGLAICKQLVELQLGKIKVDSEVGKGTMFSFDILYQTSWRQPETNARTVDLESIELKGLCILLVENNPLHQMVAKDTLEALVQQLHIELAENGKEAVEKATQRCFDVILMDLNMPEMDGYQAARKIRELPIQRSECTIIAMSASSTKQEREACVEAGMDDYIAKPFRIAELRHKLALHTVDSKKPPCTEKQPVTHLPALEEITGKDEAKKRKYISMYLMETPLLMEGLKNGINDTNWKEIKESAHALIPHFHLFGAFSLKKTAEEIERCAKAQTEIASIAGLAGELEAGVNQSYAELNAYAASAQ